MAARKKSSSRRSSSSKTNKDLFAFIVILAVVAVVTYLLTYNAIMGKVNDYVMPETSSSDYQLSPQVGQ
jgi:hypothetical protein